MPPTLRYELIELGNLDGTIAVLGSLLLVVSMTLFWIICGSKQKEEVPGEEKLTQKHAKSGVNGAKVVQNDAESGVNGAKVSGKGGGDPSAAPKSDKSKEAEPPTGQKPKKEHEMRTTTVDTKGYQLMGKSEKPATLKTTDNTKK